MKLGSRALPRIAAAFLTCTAVLVPAAALAPVGRAAAKGPAAAARPARPVTGYVTSGGYTVVPFSTATNKAGKPIRVGPAR